MKLAHELNGRRDGARGTQGCGLIAAFVISLILAVPTFADSSLLEDLERERAALLAALLDVERTPEGREQYLQAAVGRLADMERIVLRDDRLVGDTNPVVRRAFLDYDLTFLVHASAEQKRPLLDLWLDKVGLTSDTVMSAKLGRRL